MYESGRLKMEFIRNRMNQSTFAISRFSKLALHACKRTFYQQNNCTHAIQIFSELYSLINLNCKFLYFNISHTLQLE